MKMTHVECVLSDDVSTCCDDVAARTVMMAFSQNDLQ